MAIGAQYLSLSRRIALVVCGCIVCAGCVGRFPDVIAFPDREVDGKRGTVFRAEWWDYYDRGVAALDAGALEHAERDLRYALKINNRDRAWVRTYGLHFKREYYPNRMLGAVLLGLDRPQEALPFLERAREQQPSARGNDHLDEARESVFAADDTSPPAIEELSIEAGQAEPGKDPVFYFRGTVSDDTFVRRLFINEDPVDKLEALTEWTETTLDGGGSRTTFTYVTQSLEVSAPVLIEVHDISHKKSERVYTIRQTELGYELIPGNIPSDRTGTG